MKDSILIYSGGIDSTTMLYEYQSRIALAVSFDYGSNHNKKEIHYARYHTKKLNINHLIIPLNFIHQYFESSLLKGSIAIPEGKYENQNMIFSFPKKRNILDVIATIRAQVAINGVNAVFIDHIGLIKPEGVYHSSWEGVREISNTLQMLQRELNIPIFTLIQLNREAERKDADLANISGSDVIVQDADIIMTLERKRQENQDETIIPATLRILKNRNGAWGEGPLVFIPHHVVFAVDTNPQQREERKPA